MKCWKRNTAAAGWTPAPAGRAARLELGGEAQIAEAWRDQRGLPLLDMLRQDVRYGFRMMRRAPAFTLAAVLTLALGIGANAAIFSVVDAVLLRPLPYADPDRLVTVGGRAPEGMSSNVDFTTVADWRARSRTFEAFALMRTWQPTLVANGEAERVPAVRVSWNYFDMMGIRPALGRSFTPEEDRPDHWRVLLLSDGLWRRRFSADPNIVGRRITMNDREYRVVGVMPPSFEPLDAARYYAPAQLWAPIGYDVSTPDACRGCQHLRAFGRLGAGVSVAQATAESAGLGAAIISTRYLGSLVYGVSPYDPAPLSDAPRVSGILPGCQSRDSRGPPGWRGSSASRRPLRDDRRTPIHA